MWKSNEEVKEGHLWTFYLHTPHFTNYIHGLFAQHNKQFRTNTTCQTRLVVTSTSQTIQQQKNREENMLVWEKTIPNKQANNKTGLLNFVILYHTMTILTKATIYINSHIYIYIYIYHTSTLLHPLTSIFMTLAADDQSDEQQHRSFCR